MQKNEGRSHPFLAFFKGLMAASLLANGIVTLAIVYECVFAVIFIIEEQAKGSFNGNGGEILGVPFLMLPFFGVLFLWTLVQFLLINKKSSVAYIFMIILQILSLVNFFLVSGLLAVMSFGLVLIFMVMQPMPEMLFGTSFFALAVLCAVSMPILNIIILVLAFKEEVKSYYTGKSVNQDKRNPVYANQFVPPLCGRCHAALAFIPQYQRWYCPNCRMCV